MLILLKWFSFRYNCYNKKPTWQQKKMSFWCVDLGWMPYPHPAGLLSPLLTRTGEKMRWKSLWVEVRTWRLLSSYCHRLCPVVGLSWLEWLCPVTGQLCRLLTERAPCRPPASTWAPVPNNRNLVPESQWSFQQKLSAPLINRWLFQCWRQDVVRSPCNSSGNMLLCSTLQIPLMTSD